MSSRFRPAAQGRPPVQDDPDIEEQVVEDTPFESQQNAGGYRPQAAQSNGWGNSAGAAQSSGASDGWGSVDNSGGGVQGFGDSSAVQMGGFGQDAVRNSGDFGTGRRQFNGDSRVTRDFQTQLVDSKNQDGDVHEFAAMPDIAEQEDDITEQYGDAPVVQDTRLKAMRDVDRGLGFQLPAAEAGVDLSVLTSVLAPPENIIEDDVPWGWDYLFTQLSSQHHSEQDAREKEEQRIAALKSEGGVGGARKAL